MNRAVVSVGSNINPDYHIRAACDIIADEHALVGISAILTTAPVGCSDQPDFQNCALLVETELDRTSFERYLKDVEARLGRIRTHDKFAPRTIDLDMSAWNGTIIDIDYYSRDFLKKVVDEVLSTDAGLLLHHDE
jgi:2-amino-4-hydroxy-6-hydroxymethyldihydropteridine diphosphokinase